MHEKVNLLSFISQKYIIIRLFILYTLNIHDQMKNVDDSMVEFPKLDQVAPKQIGGDMCSKWVKRGYEVFKLTLNILKLMIKSKKGLRRF